MLLWVFKNGIAYNICLKNRLHKLYKFITYGLVHLKSIGCHFHMPGKTASNITRLRSASPFIILYLPSHIRIIRAVRSASMSSGRVERKMGPRLCRFSSKSAVRSFGCEIFPLGHSLRNSRVRNVNFSTCLGFGWVFQVIPFNRRRSPMISLDSARTRTCATVDCSSRMLMVPSTRNRVCDACWTNAMVTRNYDKNGKLALTQNG